MRSFCSRSMITTSQPRMPSAMSWQTRTPNRSTSAGISVRGPTTRSSGTPKVFSAWICERATLGGDLEGRARARAVLEEDVEDGASAQQRHLLHLPLRDRDELVGGIEDVADGFRGQPFRGEQMAQAPIGAQLDVGPGVQAH